MLTNIKTTGYGYKWFFLIPMALIGMAIFYFRDKVQIYLGKEAQTSQIETPKLESPQKDKIETFMEETTLDLSYELIVATADYEGIIVIKDTNPELGYDIDIIKNLIAKLTYLTDNYPSVKDHDDKIKAIRAVISQLQSIPKDQEAYDKEKTKPPLAKLQSLYYQSWEALINGQYDYGRLYSLIDTKDLIDIDPKIKALKSVTKLSEAYSIAYDLQQRIRNSIELALALKDDELQKHYLDNQTEIQRINQMPTGNSQEIQDRLTALSALYPPTTNIQAERNGPLFPIRFLVQHIKDLKFSAQPTPIEDDYIKLVLNIIQILQMEYRKKAIVQQDDTTELNFDAVKFSCKVQDLKNSYIMFFPAASDVQKKHEGFRLADFTRPLLTQMLSVIYEINCRMKNPATLTQALESMLNDYNSQVGQDKPSDVFKYIRSIVTMDKLDGPTAVEYKDLAALLKAMIDSTTARIRSNDSPELSNASSSSFLGGLWGRFFKT